VTSVLPIVILVLVAFCIMGIPAYVLAERRGLDEPWVAFVPFIGPTIVFCWLLGRSGWLTLFTLIPYVGALGLGIWVAVKLPPHQDRSGWWTLALLVPIVNLFGWWAYAFTMPRHVIIRPVHSAA
jgi:hypothetical protein